jgi:hypothetical protein
MGGLRNLHWGNEKYIKARILAKKTQMNCKEKHNATYPQASPTFLNMYRNKHSVLQCKM